MGNNTSKLILSIKNNAISTRRTTIILLPRDQDRELVVVTGNGEIEVLIVVVFMRVVVDIVVGAVQFVPGSLGLGYRGCCVAVGGAGIGAGAGFERDGDYGCEG